MAASCSFTEFSDRCMMIELSWWLSAQPPPLPHAFRVSKAFREPQKRPNIRGVNRHEQICVLFLGCAGASVHPRRVDSSPCW